MMKKQKTGKLWGWKAAAFLPLLALLLMAFGKKGENVPLKENASLKKITSPNVIKENQKPGRVIEIRKDGNYIDNKLCSLEEIVTKGKEWGKASNDWIHLRIDESIPVNRIDEIREMLENAKIYHVTQSTVNSDEIIYPVYPAGDVSESAKFTRGKWSDWMTSQLKHFPEDKSKGNSYQINYSFIIDRSGKVREGHIVKGSEYPEINAAYEKILTQIPDWKPATRNGKAVSILYHAHMARKVFNPQHSATVPPPIFIDIKKEGVFLMWDLVTLDEFRKQLPFAVKNNPQSEVWVSVKDKSNPDIQAVKNIVKEAGVSKVEYW